MKSTHWEFLIVAALGILGGLFALFGKKKPIILPVPPGPSPAQQDQDKKESEAEKKIEKAHEAVIVDITDQHDHKVEGEVVDLEKKTAEVEKDQKAVNETLLDIGKQVRGGGS